MKNILYLIIILTLTSCGKSKGKSMLPSSLGTNNKILTVIKTSHWDGGIGNEIREAFGKYQVGISRPEPIVSMSQVPITGFNRFTNTNRSILHVAIGNKDTMTVSTNKYATPQKIVYIKGKTEDAIKKMIATKADEIIKIFNNQDIEITQKKISYRKLDEKKYKTINDLGLSIDIPNTYRFVKDSLGFMWFRQRLRTSAKEDGSCNILLYSVPFDSIVLPDDFVSLRDEIGKKHIPGLLKGTYMTTEKAFAPHIFEATINHKKAYEIRGLWYTENDFEGGPFLDYVILDDKHKRYVIFEGFVYIPSKNKRDLLFNLEAIAKSIKFEE